MLQKQIRILFFLLSFFSSNLLISAQTSEIDSLLLKSERLTSPSPDSALKLAYIAAEKSQELRHQELLIRSYIQISSCYYQLDEIELNIEYADKANRLVEGISNKRLLALSTIELGRAFMHKGYYDKGAVMLRKARTITEQLEDAALNFRVYNSLGTLYLFNTEGMADSSDYFFRKTMQIAIQLKDSSKLARAYINLANLFSKRVIYDSSLVYFRRSLDIYSRLNDLDGLALANKSIGDIYYYLKETDLSIQYYEKEYYYSKLMNSAGNLAYAACDLSYMYGLKKKYDLMDKYADEALMNAKKTGSWPAMKYVGQWLGEAYEMTGNSKKALDYYKMYITAKDSMYNQDRIEKSSRLEAQSLYESKVQQMKLEEERRAAAAEAKAENQRMIRNLLVGGVLLSLSLLAVAYRGYIQKKRSHQIISEQKKEVEAQKTKIEEINKEMTDSINYARIIQRSILPDGNEIMKTFPKSFGLYRPKSVVSGDFYWFHHVKQGALIAAVDCTGHGVPGALMSMIGMEKLNEAVQAGIEFPSAILSHLNRKVKATLRQKGQDAASKDGMDIALCRFDLQNRRLYFSGAQRPLWLIRKGELLDYKSTKVSIGGTTPDEQVFEEHRIELQPGDSVYIFSDGFADQFGGNKGKKIMTKNFKELLLSIQHLPFLEQEQELEKKFREWQGNFEQVDDVLVIGIRI